MTASPWGLVCEPGVPEDGALWSAVRVVSVEAECAAYRSPYTASVPVILMRLIPFQISDIKDALASMYGVVPKVQCLPPKQVRCALFHCSFCLYQEDRFSTSMWSL